MGLLGTLTLTGAVTGLLTVRAVADGGGASLGGGDVGSLPMSVPQSTPPGSRGQAFYLRGDRHMVDMALHQYWGTGSVRVFQVSETEVWVGFEGNVRVVLDRNVLSTGAVELGLVAGSAGGGMIAAVEYGGILMPATSVARGEGFEIPYQRLDAAGTLEDDLALHTLQATGQRARLGFETGAGFLVVSQVLQPAP